MTLVINEWFPEYLSPNESLENRKKVVRFIEWFMAGSHTIMVRWRSEFLNKMQKGGDTYGYDANAKKRFSFCNASILNDSNKCQYIYEHELIPLPLSVQEKLQLDIPIGNRSTNYSSDTYLFEAAMHTDTKMIVTTDAKLIDLMADETLFEVIHLDNFLLNFSQSIA